MLMAHLPFEHRLFTHILPLSVKVETNMLVINAVICQHRHHRGTAIWIIQCQSRHWNWHSNRLWNPPSRPNQVYSIHNALSIQYIFTLFSWSTGSYGDMIHGDDHNDDIMWMYIVIAISGLFLIFCLIEGMFYVQRWKKKSQVDEMKTAKMLEHTARRSKTDTRRTASEINAKDGSIEVTMSDWSYSDISFKCFIQSVY